MSYQKKILGGPILEGSEGVAPKNFGRQNCVCSLTTLHKNEISMRCGLGEEERTRSRKQKKKKKKILIVAKSGLVGMKEYFKTYNNFHEIFFAVFKPFLNKNTSCTKLLRWFSGCKTEIT